MIPYGKAQELVLLTERAQECGLSHSLTQASTGSTLTLVLMSDLTREIDRVHALQSS